jgi:hypothetical protein
MTLIRRCRALTLLLGLAALLIAFPGALPRAGAAVFAPGASSAHPFSEPVWWPLRTETVMDCYSGNPGCTDPLYHTGWLMDVVSDDYSTTAPHEPVYAMGAGILHYGVTADTGCGGTQSRGNWIWIDHGNGTLSWYGHLAWPFSVPNGTYVTPRTQIALIGNSGYTNCRRFPTLHYIDIAVKRGATNGQYNGTYVEVPRMYACVNGQRRTWPADINPAWPTWNDVPKSSRGNESVIPASDASRGCIPVPPATPDRVATSRLVAVGSASLHATWINPSTGAAASHVIVLLQEYHPTIRRWLDERKHVLAGTATGTGFTALHVGHAFRIRVSRTNGVGISAPSAWVSATAR